MEVSDLAGISEPAKKLIEVISSAIGSEFRPRCMRREADAKAYEIRTIAAAQADAIVLKSKGEALADLERINLIAGDNPDLVERAKIRLLSREVEGQRNIEAIAEEAFSNLPVSASDQPISKDWKRIFFLNAENICDKDLQYLWGKVLAGEVVSPGSYSLRTLEILKNLSKHEAEIFRLACSLAFDDGSIVKPTFDNSNQFEEYGLTFGNLLSLRDAGLLNENDSLAKHFEDMDKSPSFILINNGVRIMISGTIPQFFSLPSLLFTVAGKELKNLIEDNPCLPYLHSVGVLIRHKGMVVKKNNITKNGSTIIESFEEDL